MSNTELCSVLDWDTAFFGLRIARLRQDTLTTIEGHSLDEWCSENDVDCLYFLARADEPSVLRAAQACGFDLVDIRVTYSRELSSIASSIRRPSEVLVRLAEPADVPALQRIARHSHTDTRFYADERFPRHLCDALYETWIARSCAGYADMVLVAESKRGIIGYISCHLDLVSKDGSIGLVGVDQQAQGRGVGQALVGQALDWFRAQQMRTVTVVTQGRNIAAQRLYQKSGFLTKSVQLWYHKWYAVER
jgi:dTDP-4-amino-4,6-dideoxy-D-galactose acyltransferase